LLNYLIFDKQFITYIVILYNHNSFTEIKNLRWSWRLKIGIASQVSDGRRSLVSVAVAVHSMSLLLMFMHARSFLTLGIFLDSNEY